MINRPRLNFYKQSVTIIIGIIFNLSFSVQAQEITAKTASGDATAAVVAPVVPAAEAAKQSVERVEVIGSRIKRIAKEGTSAVANVGKESMKNSANTSASDSLRDTTMATNGVGREQSGSSAAATATIGLRGLGDTRTLVLLNGHRLPKDPAVEAVDLNLIPQSAIERIEVLKDGASALYGSDALGGVINIVTKKNFTGNEVSTKLSAVENPGGTAYDVSLLSGLSDEKTDLLVALSYNHQDKIFGKDRGLTKEGLSPTGSTGAYKDVGGTWHVQPGCPPDLQRPDASGNGDRCYFRYNEIATIRPQVGQINLLTDVTLRVDSGLKFYNRNLIVHKDIEWSYAPTPAGFATPTGTPSVPAARTVAYRFMEAGNRDEHDTELNYSSLWGLKGNINSTWEYDVSAGYSEINRKNKGTGYLDNDILNSLVQSGTFDPLAPAGSRGDISSALSPVFQNAKSNLFTVDTLITGELGELDAGPIGIATGTSYINEKLDQQTDDKSAAGIIIGSSGSNDQGNRDIVSAFAEVSFPLYKTLEVDLAARVDHYSEFGTTINPKLSAKWNIAPSLLVRASVGTGFKAPTLSQLYGASSDGYQEFIDRKLCVAHPGTAACKANQYHITGGGNKDLKEEKAFSAGLGTVYQATSDISFSIDAWYTKVSNIIDIDYEDLTIAEMNGVNTGAYGVTITRDSNGAIDTINAPSVNLLAEEITGVDFNTEMNLVNNLWGHHLVLDDDFSYIVIDNYEGFPGAGTRNVVREWGHPGWKNILNLSLKNDLTSYGITMRSIPGQNVKDRFINKKISDLNEFDISAGYKFSKTSQLSGGIKNIMNAAQPADMEGGTGGAPVINNSLYDVNGRKFFVSYSQKF